MQLAQIEIVVNGNGEFIRARVLEKSESNTLIPCTEASGGRAGSKPVNHPLCDKLQYLSHDFAKFGTVTSGYANDTAAPHNDYVASLKAWHDSNYRHNKLDAIYSYVMGGTLIADLIKEKVLHIGPDNRLIPTWQGPKEETPPIFKAIAATQEQGDAFVRWSVNAANDPASGTWQDLALIQSWIGYYRSAHAGRGLCMITGDETALAIQHPAKLRHGGDKAKLISSNDSSGYTFRGKFYDADEAAGIAFEVTQKAHNALRWLIARQAYHDKASGQVFVAWSCNGAPVPDPLANSFGLLDEYPDEVPVDTSASQAFALRLRKVIAGYKSKLTQASDIVVLGLDAATPGRMAVTFYREIKGSEFLNRIEAWHNSFAWFQNFGKDSHFIGAPAPRDVAEAAFGRRLDEKLKKATVERLLPCIVDQQALPYDLVLATIRRASNRVGLDHWEWEKCLGIACALFRGYHTKRSYDMALESNRTTRDYLYGRLLAIAENIESRALFVAGEKRDTTAARLMQRFADRPMSTWKQIELALGPYKSRLRSQRAGFLFEMERLLDETIGKFTSNDFLSDAPLTGEFLLGYHCQRQDLRPTKTAEAADDDTTN